MTYPQPNGQPYDPFNPTNGGSPDQDYNLECVKTLTPDKNTTGYYARGACSFIRNYKILRLSNAVQPPSSAPAFLNTQYQPMMEKVTDMSMRLPFPDEFFSTAVSGALYWLYKFGDDERAGTVIKQGNSVEYTGQLAEFHANLAANAAQDCPSEVSTFFPETPIGAKTPQGIPPYVFIN